MKLNDYQREAATTAIAATPDHMAFGLLEEAGEVAGIFKRYHRGDFDYRCELTDHPWLSTNAALKVKGELGDVLWYVAMLASLLGYTLEDVAAYNLRKLHDRKARDAIMGDGDVR